MVNRIRGNSGRFLKSLVSCLLPFLGPGCLRGTLNCQLAQPCIQTSSAWHGASSCWGSSPCGCSCRQHPLQASMGGWEEYLRIFFPYFHRITGVLQVLAGARLLPCECQGSCGGSGVGRAWRCGAHHSVTVSCGTMLSLHDSPAQPEPCVAAGPRAEVPRRAPQAAAPPRHCHELGGTSMALGCVTSALRAARVRQSPENPPGKAAEEKAAQHRGKLGCRVGAVGGRAACWG